MGCRCTALLLASLIGAVLPSPTKARDVAVPGGGGANAQALVVTSADSQHLLQWGSQAPFRSTSAEILSPRLLEFSNSPVRVALWEEKSDSGAVETYYAVSLTGVSFHAVQKASYELLLRYAEFDPATTGPSIPARLFATGAGNLYIVQFQTQPLDVYRDEIRALGGVALNYLANQSHIVLMSPEVREKVAALPFVRFVGPYQPAFRMDEEMFGALSMKNGRLPDDQRYQMLTFEPGLAQKSVVAARIESIGGSLVNVPEGGHLLEAVLTTEQLLQVANWDEVFWIDRWLGEPSDDLNIARQIGGADYVENLTGYSGEGVTAEVLDSGCLQTHTNWTLTPLVHGPYTASSHGTSTSGCVLGNGDANVNTRGLAPDAQLVIAVYSFLGDRYTFTSQTVQAPYFAVLQSNSWGDPQTCVYTSKSFEMDDMIHDFDLIITQSQSNTNNCTSRPQAWAKNVVSVGGVNHVNTLTMADDFWSGASIGFAQDGRIKPDFTHFYDSVATADSCSNTCWTSGFGGTSAATPITAGHFALFFQMWHAGIFGNLTSTSVFDSKPHFSLAKAMMINTATQYPFTEPGANLARNKQGWGLANVQTLYDSRNEIVYVNETEILTNLSSWTYTADVLGGEPDLRVTMHYPDPPGTVSSTQHRLNDLTLKVTDPNGTFYWGNNGLKNGNWSVAGGAADTKDTVENVLVQNPMAGRWTIEVSGDDINTDSHVETPAVDADFALTWHDFNPTTSLCLGQTPLLQGGTTQYQVTSANPGETVLFLIGFNGMGSGICLFGGQLCLDLLAPLIFVAGTAVADSNGIASLGIPIPSGAPAIPVAMQAYVIDLGQSQFDKSNPVERTIQ